MSLELERIKWFLSVPAQNNCKRTQRIPVVTLEESFDYLDKSFNYKMNTGPVEVSLYDDLKSYLQITDKLNLHPASKSKSLMSTYIAS